MPAPICAAPIDDKRSRKNGHGYGGRAKNTSPASISTPRARAIAASSPASTQAGACTQIEAPPCGSVNSKSGRSSRSAAAASASAFLHRLVDAARVRLVVAEREEERVRVLQERARMAHHRMAQHAQLLHQRARRDDVAQAKRRRQALRHRADVDDAAALVQALQRRHRRAGVQVFGLVVVLDHDEVCELGLAQQPAGCARARASPSSGSGATA